MIWKQRLSQNAVFAHACFTMQRQKQALLCFMWLSEFWGNFYFYFFLIAQPGHNHISSAQHRKPPNRARRGDEGSVTSKCSAALPESLNDFCISDSSSKTVPAFPVNAQRHTQPKENYKELDSDKGNLIRAKPSLKLPPAECSALAEWSWFNLCISCHGFPFFPTIMTWEEAACWVTATRKHAENRLAMLRAATAACLACPCIEDNLSILTHVLLSDASVSKHLCPFS